MSLRPMARSDLPAVEALLHAAATDKGFDVLSEEARIDLMAGGFAVLLEDRGEPVGCAARRIERDGVVVELAVAPDAGGDAFGLLLDDMLERSEGQAVRLLAVDDAAKAAGRARGLRHAGSLLELECPLPAGDRVDEPEGVRIRVFRPGEEVPAMVGVHRAAFPGSPWTEADVTDRLSRPWFDAEGVFVAWEGARAIGTSWTKMHPGAVGEIYLLAVHPEAEGRSLGRKLALTALDHVHEAHGATRGLAFADAVNERATRLYAGLGFETVRVRECLEG